MIRAFRRFEGISDPDDMAIVYAIEGDHVRGTLTDAYGVYADPETGVVLARIRISPHRSSSEARRARSHWLMSITRVLLLRATRSGAGGGRRSARSAWPGPGGRRGGAPRASRETPRFGFAFRHVASAVQSSPGSAAAMNPNQVGIIEAALEDLLRVAAVVIADALPLDPGRGDLEHERLPARHHGRGHDVDQVGGAVGVELIDDDGGGAQPVEPVRIRAERLELAGALARSDDGARRSPGAGA